ncbi:MAG: DUF4442 domain-containing protein [Bacteroidetes bacterium]|nr:DUF4442 domain-containing protein [Bacteroidota bacterium]
MTEQYHPGFLRLLRNPVKFRLYLLTQLPSAYFAGLRIVEVDEVRCSVAVPFKWFTRNPFRSTYFACLSMAAEMSTGILAMAAVYRRKPPISMLVVGLEASFHKKATGRTTFVCVDGSAIKEAVSACIATGEARQVRARSVGTNSNGEIVAEFFITWSFKVRTRL